MNRFTNQRIAFWLLGLASYSIVVITGFILIYIIFNGWRALTWEFFTGAPSMDLDHPGGISTPIVGTVALVLLSILIALPIGVGCAIFLSEYSKTSRFTRIIRSSIITLAGVPSIVYGLFGLGLFVMFLKFGSSLLAGSLTLSCMILPLIIVASEESLRAVPQGFREASLALGATKWQTITKNVLPYAMPGILTGSILGIGRVAGETAPIMLTAAAFFLPRLPDNLKDLLFNQVMALPYHLYILSTQFPDTDAIRLSRFGTALTLLIIVLGVNLIAIVFRSYFRKKYVW